MSTPTQTSAQLTPIKGQGMQQTAELCSGSFLTIKEKPRCATDSWIIPTNLFSPSRKRNMSDRALLWLKDELQEVQITDCAGVSNEGWGLQSKADPQGSGGSRGWEGGEMGGDGRGSNGTGDGLFHPQVRDQRTESTGTNKLIGNCQPPKTLSQWKSQTPSCTLHLREACLSSSILWFGLNTNLYFMGSNIQ